jgi:hypothetical protein
MLNVDALEVAASTNCSWAMAKGRLFSFFVLFSK